MLYSSVNIDVAATRFWRALRAELLVSEETRIRIEEKKPGCPADSPTIFCASVSAWLNILYESPLEAPGAFDHADSSFLINL